MISSNARNILFHIFDVVLNIVIIIAIVVVIRSFIVSPFQIEGSSMIETLENHEYIVINKFRYLFRTPERGDIVVFRPPSDESKFYVKRVIGLPGDRITVRDGYVYVRNSSGKDVKLSEPYLGSLNSGKTYRYPVHDGDTTKEVFDVPQGSYFVLGDNRQGSLDSRSFAHETGHFSPFVPEDNIKGSVWFVALPVNKIHAFQRPVYQID